MGWKEIKFKLYTYGARNGVQPSCVTVTSLLLYLIAKEKSSNSSQLFAWSYILYIG